MLEGQRVSTNETASNNRMLDEKTQDTVKNAQPTRIDLGILDVRVNPGLDSDADQSDLAFAWEVIDFKTDSLELQLDFQKPLFVSS